MRKNIIVFDGDCNLCNGIVGRLTRLAPTGLFQMVAFQSPLGQELLQKNGFSLKYLETVILFDEKGLHTYSDGFLRILTKIPKWHLLGKLLSYTPKIIRDTLYILAAKNRVRWFGKSQICTVSF